MAEGSLSLSSQNLLARLVAPVLGCMLALVLGMLLVNDRDNALSSFMNMVGFVGIFVGAVSPRIGIYLLAFLCAYLDFVKRLLILFGHVDMDDVVHVLRVAPFVLVGVSLGLVLAYAFKRFRITRTDWILVFLILGLEAAIVASSFRNGGGLTEAANSGAYVPMILIVPLVFRTVDELLALCRVIVTAFLPVALYGIWQGVFGLADFEYQYLLSGLTTTTGGILDDLKPRAFSTLNSPHAFQISMGICFLISIMLGGKTLRARSGLWNSSVRVALPLIFVTSSILGLARNGWCVWSFGLLGFWAFKTSRRTLSFYATFLVAFALLVANAQFILDRLEYIQQMMPSGSSFADQAFRVTTYSERLFGYRNVFTNRDLITWFGNPAMGVAADGISENKEEVVHDVLSQVLVSYGLVGLLVTVVIAVLFLYWAHGHALRLVSLRTKALTIALLSTIMGVLVSGMLTGGSIGLFPINFLFWGIIGMMISIARTQEEIEGARLVPGLVKPRYQRRLASHTFPNRQVLPYA